MKRILYPFITFIIIFILGEFLLLFLNHEKEDKEHNTLNAASFLIAQNIQQQITMGIASTTTLESMLKLNNFKTINFEEWAKEIKKTAPFIENIQLAPNGIIKYIYPITEHKKAIGHNLFSDVNRIKGGAKAFIYNDITFVGPLKLIQNNKLAIIARKAIFKEQNKERIFWGFSIIIIYLDDIIDNAFKGLDKSKLAYKLYGANSDHEESNLMIKSKNSLDDHSICYPIKLPNTQWHLLINYIHQEQVNTYLLHFIIFFFSLFMSSFIFYFEKRSFIQTKKLKELNKMLEKMANTDILTKLDNRRSGLVFIQKQLGLCIREKEDFTICFFDIDFFKKINDEYGHEVGDLALQHFVKVSELSIRKSDMLARWGGEEFILVLPMTDEKGAYFICEKLRKLLDSTEFILKNNSIHLTVSIGIASLKNSKEDIDELLKRADTALYQAKDKGRNQTIIN